MEKITTGEKDFHEVIVDLDKTTKQLRQAFIGNAGIVVGVFLAFVAAMTVFADIKITSFLDLASLSMRYFIMLFASYQIYVNTADSGTRRGLVSDVYVKCRDRYEAMRAKVIDEGLQGLLPEYCKKRIERELINTRTNIVAVIGMSYDELTGYLSRDIKEINKDPKLSKTQRKIIIKALKVKPIKLTPEMIMHSGGSNSRSPLGFNPRYKKIAVFGGKFVTTAITLLFILGLAVEVVANPTVDKFIYVSISIVPAVLNGFTGYKFGYENIVFDTVEFTDAQSSIIDDFLKETNDGRKDQCADEARV